MKLHRKPDHNHDDGALTIGCPACIFAVQRDQEAAARAEVPRSLRSVTVRWRAEGTVVVDLEIPDDVVDADDVESWLGTPDGSIHEGDILDEIDGALIDAQCDDFEIYDVSAPPSPDAAPRRVEIAGQLDLLTGAA